MDLFDILVTYVVRLTSIFYYNRNICHLTNLSIDFLIFLIFNLHAYILFGHIYCCFYRYINMSGGDRCMFLNCKNTRKTSKTVFHSIPSANKEISKEWIINSGNQFLIFI